MSDRNYEQGWVCDPNSALIWHPRLVGIRAPQPETVILNVGHALLSRVIDGKVARLHYWQRVVEAADRLGYPLFVRTDLASGKHDFERTCYVACREDLAGNVARLVEENELASLLGLPYEALVLRRYVELDSAFRAFRGGLPIAPERRYFAADGRVQCRHAYWPAEALEQACDCDQEPCSDLPSDWRTRLTMLNEESENEVALLTGYAEEASARLEGAWSLDFARARGGTWYLIDAATAADSWHPEDCPVRPAEVTA